MGVVYARCPDAGYCEAEGPSLVVFELFFSSSRFVEASVIITSSSGIRREDLHVP